MLLREYVVVLAERSVSCSFDGIDFCGYQDQSDTGINWSQIHNQSKIISYSCFTDPSYRNASYRHKQCEDINT